MQRLIDQRDNLSGKFTAKLFLVISIMAGDRFFNLRKSFIKDSFLQKFGVSA